MTERRARSCRWIVLALVALGAVSRIVCAQGGLWLDEAWSAVQAHEAATPLGVFLNINHDNNHHLNSLWMQLVGFGAPSLAVRALAIVTGTASIAVAAAIAMRRGAIAAIVTAALFAISPAMVTMGSEARGYAPMMLALLCAIFLTDRWLDEGAERDPSLALGLCFFLGALSQLTIVFGFCAILGWVVVVLIRRDGWRRAARPTLRLFVPTLVALAAVFAIVLAGAIHGGGFAFGTQDAFTWERFSRGYAALIASTLGIPVEHDAWLAIPAVLLLVAGLAGVSRIALHMLAVVGFPLTLAIIHASNTGHPRYFLVVGLALLLLLGELLGLWLTNRGWRRAIAIVLLAVVAAGSVAADIGLARDRRGDSAQAIRTLQNDAPAGARVGIDRAGARAVLEVGAAQAHYPLAVVADCSPAAFLFADRFRGEYPPPALDHCGRHYVAIAGRRTQAFSGTNWNLYRQSR